MCILYLCGGVTFLTWSVESKFSHVAWLDLFYKYYSGWSSKVICYCVLKMEATPVLPLYYMNFALKLVTNTFIDIILACNLLNSCFQFCNPLIIFLSSSFGCTGLWDTFIFLFLTEISLAVVHVVLAKMSFGTR